MILDHMFSDLPHLCFAGPGISLLLYAADDRRCQFHLRFNPQNSVAYTIPHVRPTEHRVDTDRQVAVGVAVATHYYVIPAPPDFAHVAVRLPPTRRRGSCHSATDKCVFRFLEVVRIVFRRPRRSYVDLGRSQHNLSLQCRFNVFQGVVGPPNLASSNPLNVSPDDRSFSPRKSKAFPDAALLTHSFTPRL